MKKTIFLVVLILIPIISFGQKMSLETHLSLHYDIFNLSNNKKDYFKQRFNALDPSYNLYFAYETNSNIVLNTGFSYYSFGHNLGIKDLIFEDIYSGLYIKIFKSFSVPLYAGYKFDLSKKFKLSFYSGVDISYYFSNLGGVIQGNYYNVFNPDDNKYFKYDFTNALKQKVNIHVSNSAKLSYVTNSNISFNLHCSFHSGLFNIWEEVAKLEINNASEIYEPSITSRGSYWNFGFGVGYVFGTTNDKTIN